VTVQCEQSLARPGLADQTEEMKSGAQRELKRVWNDAFKSSLEVQPASPLASDCSFWVPTRATRAGTNAQLGSEAFLALASVPEAGCELQSLVTLEYSRAVS
jgi:hypothetical protein